MASEFSRESLEQPDLFSPLRDPFNLSQSDSIVWPCWDFACGYKMAPESQEQ
jgi:hypothetical protein